MSDSSGTMPAGGTMAEAEDMEPTAHMYSGGKFVGFAVRLHVYGGTHIVTMKDGSLLLIEPPFFVDREAGSLRDDTYRVAGHRQVTQEWVDGLAALL